MSSRQRPEPAHVITIDLTDDDVENCWCCHEVIRTREESRPRFLLVEFGYVICETCEEAVSSLNSLDCAEALSGLSQPPKTLKLYGVEDCPVCMKDVEDNEDIDEEQLIALSCGHTFCKRCLSRMARGGNCPTCRQPLETGWPIRITRCGVERSLPQQTALSAHPPPGTTGLTNIFRVGELVWYEHDGWRPGVILSIVGRAGTGAVARETDSHYNFILAPLGHAMIAQANVIKGCQSIQPFLARSTHISNELEGRTFDTVNWRALISRHMQDPDPNERARLLEKLSIEASVLGARTINNSYSTFGLISKGATTGATVCVKTYEGVYLGAEMVRVGDPIRVGGTISHRAGLSPMTPVATLVMLVNEIQVVETFQQHPCSTLYFKGDVYRTIRSNSAEPLPGDAVRAKTLGPAFVEELTTLNAIENDKSMRWSWVMVLSQELCPEQEVQGRFYVTEKLMRIIDPRRYKLWIERGGLDEASTYLSNRGNSGARRRPGRAATFGEAVSVREEMMAYLDWSRAEDASIEGLVAQEREHEPFDTGRRGVGDIWRRIERDVEVQQASYS
ncbi:hypothetical protein VTK56DRAFT_4852 [Thermocarpiscus australiensis]